MIRFVRTGQLSGNDKTAVLEKALDCHTAISVMPQAVGHNGICDLITDLVGVSCGYLFTCDDPHSFFLLIKMIEL